MVMVVMILTPYYICRWHSGYIKTVWLQQRVAKQD